MGRVKTVHSDPRDTDGRARPPVQAAGGPLEPKLQAFEGE